MLLELSLNYLFIFTIWKNGVILLLMMYLKSPLIKFGIIEMFVDVKKLFTFYIFEIKEIYFSFQILNMHNQILFLKWDFFS